jgi:hypothetical protein
VRINVQFSEFFVPASLASSNFGMPEKEQEKKIIEISRKI